MEKNSHIISKILDKFSVELPKICKVIKMDLYKKNRKEYSNEY